MALSTHDRLAAIHGEWHVFRDRSLCRAVRFSHAPLPHIPLAAAFACIAVLITLPIALLTARLFRNNPSWIRTHLFLNTATAILLIVAFALGIASILVGSDDGDVQLTGDEADVHHTLGLAVFVLFMVQVVIGFGAHYWKRGRKRGDDIRGGARPLPEGSDTIGDKQEKQLAATTLSSASSLSQHPEPTRSRSRQKSPLRWIHISLGILLVGLLYWQTWNGLDTEWAAMSSDGGDVPEVVKVLFWVLVAVPVAVWVLHLGQEALGSMEEEGALRLH